MMADFPPLPTFSQSNNMNLATWCEMFPTMQKSVVEMVLEEAKGNNEKAMELLLGMSEEQNHSLEVKSDPCKASLSQVSARFLSPGPSSQASSLYACPAIPTTCHIPIPLMDNFPEGPLTDLQKGHHVLALLRGLPGSGKSTLAKSLILSAKLGISLSTDNFFIKKGVYTFRPELLSQAHESNQKNAREAVRDKVRFVIIDNTNTVAWEMRPYIELALNNGYKVHIIEPDTPWKFKPKLLASKNSHNVPRQTIEKMLDRYEKNISLERLKTLWNISEPIVVDSLNGEEEEIFESDDEVLDEPIAHMNIHAYEHPSNNNPVISVLNPASNEFVPNQYQGMIDEEVTILEKDQEEQDRSNISVQAENDLIRSRSMSYVEDSCPDISRLVAMFPHLSIEEATTLYNQHGQQTREVISSLLETKDDPVTTDQQTVSMALDPIFAVTLQEHFGPPVDDSLLQFLNTGELLSVDIPADLARQLFSLWQRSIQDVLHSKPILETGNHDVFRGANQHIPNMQAQTLATGWSLGGRAQAETAQPRTVLAPNAVDYYEKKELEQAVKASIALNNSNKTKPVIVVKSRTEQQEDDLEESGLEQFIEQRDMLYRKAMETRGNKMAGAASYYAAQARELNSHIKASQKQNQMEQFLEANRDSRSSKLDLHYLQTSDAIKQLQQFITQREGMGRSSKSGTESVEVVTGKGNRSENGKSRLRPAVQNWLDQKNYSYTEVNSGCFRVSIKSGK